MLGAADNLHMVMIATFGGMPIEDSGPISPVPGI